MSEPPHPSGLERPQDTPRFPSYGRDDAPRPPEDQPVWNSSDDQRRAGETPFVPPGPLYGNLSEGAPPFGGAQYPAPQPWQAAPGYPAVYGTPPPPYSPGYGGGYGYSGVSQPRTNGLAIAALVTGLAGIVFGICGPVAVGLGIAALVQLKRRNERGTAQAVIGMVLGTLEVLFYGALLVIFLAVGLGSDDSDDYGSPVPTSSVEPAPVVSVEELRVGECFDEGDEDDEVIRSPCADLHDAELYALVTMPAGAYPGDRKLEKAAEAACDKKFSAYVGITVEKSVLEPDFWYPDRETWEDGDHVVICTTYGPDADQLAGSVKGTKR